MVPRALVEGVRNSSKSVYSSDSQLLLSKPSVSGAYLRSTQEKQLIGYQIYCFQYVATEIFLISVQLYYFQYSTWYVAADVFSFFGLSCAVSSTTTVCSRFVFFSCHRIISHDTIYVEQKESIGGHRFESVHPTDSVVFRTCQQVVSSLFRQSQSFFFDRFCVDRFYEQILSTRQGLQDNNPDPTVKDKIHCFWVILFNYYCSYRYGFK